MVIMGRDKFILPYNGNIHWLHDQTFLVVKAGSYAYNTAIPGQSDLDIRGIFTAPKEYVYGFLNVIEQVEGKDPCDFVAFEARKFFRLAIDCNPNILDLIFASDEDFLYLNKLGERLLSVRDLFLSKRAKFAYAGYARAQYKRMILHRAHILNPPPGPPNRSDFGLEEKPKIPENQVKAALAAIQKYTDQWEFNLSGVSSADRIRIIQEVEESFVELIGNSDGFYDKGLAAGRAAGLDFDLSDFNMLEYLDKERRFRNKQREWEQYLNWKKNRNPARYAMEEKFGYDGKHASHLYRLYCMCKEILQLGKIIVKRPDAEQILAIRNGAWTFEQLTEWADNMDKEIAELYKTSTLRHSPDKVYLDKVCQEIVEESLR